MIRLTTSNHMSILNCGFTRTTCFEKGILEKVNKSYFLNCFNFANTHISAYKNYLAEQNINPKTINDLKSFQQLPQTDKESYILQYPLTMLFPNAEIPELGHSSSGSSGRPTLWFRGSKQTKIGSKIHEKILTNIFNIRKEDPTLVLICFAMGTWIAGTYSLIACHDISKKGYKITTFSAGMDPEAICAILKKSAACFKNIVMFGYPFFLDVVLKELIKQKISIPEDLFIITAGDKFSEDWRKNILTLISKPIEDSARIINIYGSSDAGILGHETPLSIAIRQAALDNEMLYRAIFDETSTSVLPTLVQYNPKHIFFEEKAGELLITANLDCPLIRYNIHDKGKIIRFSEMKKLLSLTNNQKLHEHINNSSFKLPFLVIDKKTDVSVVFEAVKIFPEQIKSGICDPKISHLLSGSFMTYTKKLNNENRLHLELELAIGLREISDFTKQMIVDCILKHLKTSNSEYRIFNASFPALTIPILSFHPWGGPDQFKTPSNNVSKNPTMVSLVGKKTKILA